jgi:hypothetical protein
MLYCYGMTPLEISKVCRLSPDAVEGRARRAIRYSCGRNQKYQGYQVWMRTRKGGKGYHELLHREPETVASGAPIDKL